DRKRSTCWPARCTRLKNCWGRRGCGWTPSACDCLRLEAGPLDAKRRTHPANVAKAAEKLSRFPRTFPLADCRIGCFLSARRPGFPVALRILSDGGPQL